MQDDMTQDEIDAILKSSGGNSDDSDVAGDIQSVNAAEKIDSGSSAAPGQAAQGPIPGSGGMTAPQMTTFQTGNVSSSSSPSGTTGNINFLLHVPLDVTVELGRTKIAVKDMLQLGPGSVIELDKLIGEPVDLLVNERLIARGEVVIFDESFGVRITDIINPEDRIRSLG